MHIDWAALGLVAVVSVVASIVFVVLLAYGVRFISAAKVLTNQGSRATTTLSRGYAFIGGAGVLVLYCIDLIVPQFH
ncbi:MAG: hypothetical protein ABWY56_16775 [Propionibacteriaceae bacterium]